MRDAVEPLCLHAFATRRSASSKLLASLTGHHGRGRAPIVAPVDMMWAKRLVSQIPPRSARDSDSPEIMMWAKRLVSQSFLGSSWNSSREAARSNIGGGAPGRRLFYAKRFMLNRPPCRPPDRPTARSPTAPWPRPPTADRAVSSACR